MIKFTFDDGSEWTMEHPAWIKAWEKKGATEEEFIAAVKKEHQAITQEGITQASIAETEMYGYIRAALMGIAFSEATDGKGKVVGIQEDGSTREYP